MQANNAIPYMQIQTSQQTDYKGSSGKSDKDNSFSKALDKELSQGQTQTEKPATSDKPAAAEKPAAPEKPTEAPKGDKTEVADSQIAVVLPLIIQNPNLQQMQAEQLTQVQQPETLVGAVSGVELETGTKNPAILSQTAGPEEAMNLHSKGQPTFQQAAETANAAPAAVENRQPITENQVKTEPVSTQQTADTGKTEAVVIKPVAEGETNQPQTELKDANLADMSSKAVRQDMVGRQAAFEAPQVTEKPTVDMTDIKAGIQKLSQSMADHMAKGRTEFEIWLEPANLGKMAIKVAYESGRAMISIMCTNEKAMEMISQNARNLGNILEQHTGNDTVVVVEHPESDYLQQQAEQENKEGYQQQEQNSGTQDDTDGETQTFLEQLRLGLM